MFFILLVAGALALAFLLLLASAGPAAVRIIVAVAAVLVAFVGPAYADTSMLADLAGSVVWPILSPVLWTVGGIAALAAGNAAWKLVNRALDLFEKRTGIQIDAERRAALHSALDTGLQLAIRRGAPILETAMAAWVKESVPDAVAHFGLTDDKLDMLVDAKLGKAAAGAPLALPGAILAGASEGAAAISSLVAAPLQILGAAA